MRLKLLSFLLFCLIGFYVSGNALAGNSWEHLADFSDQDKPLATQQKTQAFANKIKVGTDGIVYLWFAPQVPQNASGTVTATNKPNGSVALPSLFTIYGFTEDTQNAVPTSAGIANSEKNYVGVVETSNIEVYSTGKKVTITGVYGYIGITTPSLSTAGSTGSIVAVYAKTQ